MNTDKLRQQITVVTNDLPALDVEGASGDDFARHLAGLKQRVGESRVDLMAYGRTPWS
jgi:hypothetical protein